MIINQKYHLFEYRSILHTILVDIVIIGLSHVGVLQTAHYWANPGFLLGVRMRRGYLSKLTTVDYVPLDRCFCK